MHYVIEHSYKKDTLPVIYAVLDCNPDLTIKNQENNTPGMILMDRIEKEKGSDWLASLLSSFTAGTMREIEQAYGSKVVWYSRESVLKLVAWICLMLCIVKHYPEI